MMKAGYDLVACKVPTLYWERLPGSTYLDCKTALEVEDPQTCRPKHGHHIFGMAFLPPGDFPIPILAETNNVSLECHPTGLSMPGTPGCQAVKLSGCKL